MKIKKGFTLMEILIVVAIIAVVATVAIILFDPFQQIGKGYDTKRKHELAQLQKVMEDYYNDKGCYPKPADICYDVPPPPTNVCAAGGVGSYKLLESQTCHICGNESSSPLSLSSYLSRLPCDPQHKQKQYIYEVPAAPATPPFLCSTSDPNATSPCPQWYRVYSNLSVQSDPSIKDLGCQGSGCGSAPNYGFDYGVTSPNQKLNITSQYIYHTSPSNTCDACPGKTFEECEVYTAPANIYPSKQNCCLIRPKPIGC